MVFASIEKDFDLTPFDTMSVREKTRLLHYKSIDKHTQDQEPAHPILMIYAPINRFHIMDISQERSVVKSLLSKGLDVYLLDWGYPGWEDSSLSNTILANWARVIDSDQIVDEFGHLDGQVLDIDFLMRNPPRYTFDKYLKLFKRYNDKQFVDDFISVEKWLYDTPIVPGNLYRQVINDCYKNNLLISNKMKVDRSIIDLKKITVPLLTIVAEDNDLVSNPIYGGWEFR